MSLTQGRPRVAPVWSRLPAVFRYPFHFDCLVAILGYGLLFLVGIVVPLVGWIMALVAYLGIYKFAADVLESTARGWLKPPEHWGDGNRWMLFKHFVLIIALVLVLVLVAMLTGSTAVTVIVGLCFMLAMPAAVILVVMTNSLAHALNPIAWLHIMRRTGKAYFIAVGLLAMLALSQGFAERLLAEMLGPGAASLAGGFVIGGYFLVASYHLMGYLVYEKHEALGLEVDVEPTEVDAQTNAYLSPLLREVEPLVEQGDVDKAIVRLRDGLSSGGLIEEHERYRQLLALREDRDGLLEHARDYIPALLHAFDQPKKAISVAEESLALDPAFRPREPGMVLELATLLDRFERFDAVLKLTSGFAQANPQHADIPANYYLAARGLWFGRGQDRKALDLARNLVATYPNHPRRPEAEQLAEAIERGPVRTPAVP